MKYKINHVTEYYYNNLVVLGPHVIRLIPKSTAIQHLINCEIEVFPEPAGKSEIVDFFGNRCLSVWFTGKTEKLTISAISEVEAIAFNPFQFLLDSNWLNLPLGKPVIRSNNTGILREMEKDFGVEFTGNTVHVLQLLCNIIYQKISQIKRLEGVPHDPMVTWHKKEGACRDLAVLFMECCSCLGIPSRFVSGYLHHRSEEEQHMHAWVEIYLEGAGWRAMDPTNGLFVENEHISVASAPESELASPITGSYGGKANLEKMDISIEMIKTR